MDKLHSAWLLLLRIVDDAKSFNRLEVAYRRSAIVTDAVVILATAFCIGIIYRQLWPSNQSFYPTSGIKISRANRVGLSRLLPRLFTWLLALASLGFLAVALADPVVYVVNTAEQFESREIGYLSDVSASMGFKSGIDPKVSRGEVKRDLISSLIQKRKSKKDRAFFIIFGTQAEIRSSFTEDPNSLLFTASMSPIAFAPAVAREQWANMFILKKGQWLEDDYGGGTSLHLGLQLSTYLFDTKGSKKINDAIRANPVAKMRSIVIDTEGAADIDPEKQFMELRKRRIIPYLIFIDPLRQIEKELYGDKSPKAELPDQLLQMVRRYGGEYFLAKDRDSIEKISAQIDRLQTIRTEKRVTVKERTVYYVPLSISFMLGLAAIISRLTLWLFWRTV